MLLRFFILILVLFLGFWQNGATQKILMDTTYVSSGVDKLVSRIYMSRKFTDFRVWDPVGGQVIRYLPNSGHNIGLGFSYRKITLNVSYPFAMLNPNRRSDFPLSLDLQTHLYLTRWIFDFFGQFYRGYVIPDFGENSAPYLRRDLRLDKIGFLAGYVFDGQRISLQSAAQQSGIQLKSAISPVLGMEGYHVVVQGDSDILPVDSGFPVNFRRGDYYHFGPNSGFLGTWVFGKGFFVTGSFLANLGVSFSQWDQNPTSKDWAIVPGYSGRIFAGYNGNKLAINANYVYKNLRLTSLDGLHQSSNTGNYRINFVYKFDVRSLELKPWW